jgi:tetratricopeptide (TPR) repeat protein
LIGLARTLTDAAQLAEAEERLDELLAAHPAHPEGLVERGRLALRRGRIAQAAEFLERAVRAAPWHRAGNRLYLSALEQLGHSEAAAQCEAHLAGLRAEDAEGGRLQLRLVDAIGDPGRQWDLYQWSMRNGRSDDALACLLETLRRAPLHGPAHAALADYFSREGQPRRAAQHRALAMGPR